MYSTLVPCPACARHVLASEAACPFCAAALPPDLAARAVPSAPGRLGRAAAFVFGASLAVTACSSEVNGGNDAGAQGGAGGGVVEDDGGGMALYGVPPPEDAGPTDDGGSAALYGVPPPEDAGPPDDGGTTTDGGGGQPIYGAPPPPKDP